VKEGASLLDRYAGFSQSGYSTEKSEEPFETVKTVSPSAVPLPTWLKPCVAGKRDREGSNSSWQSSSVPVTFWLANSATRNTIPPQTAKNLVPSHLPGCFHEKRAGKLLRLLSELFY
jgi:hypothetical protein